MLKNDSVIGQKQGKALTITHLKKNPVGNLQYVAQPDHNIYVIALIYCESNKRQQLIQLIPKQFQTEQFWHQVIRDNPKALDVIKNPSYELCSLALEASDKFNVSEVYLAIPNPDLELQQLAVSKNGEILRYISVQTDELCLTAVQQNGNAVKYVQHPTTKIYMAAVQQYGHALGDIKEKDRTPELCLAAVQNDGKALIDVPQQTDALCLAAVQKDGEALRYVINQTPAICMAAVQSQKINYFEISLKFVKQQTPELCLAAVKHYGLALQHVKEKNDELCLAAIKQEGMAIKFVPTQHPEWCMLAVQQRGTAIMCIKQQTPELCLAAVQQNGEALTYVKEQTEEICLVAIAQTTKAHAMIRDEFLRTKLPRKISKTTKAPQTVIPQFKPQPILNSDFVDHHINVRLDNQKIIETIHLSWWQNRYQPDHYWSQWVEVMNGNNPSVSIRTYVNHEAAFLLDSAVFQLNEFNFYHYIRILNTMKISLFTIELNEEQQSQLHIQNINLLNFLKTLEMLNHEMNSQLILQHMLNHPHSCMTQILLKMKNIDAFVNQNFEFIHQQSQNFSDPTFRQGFKQLCYRLPQIQLYIEDLLLIFKQQSTIKKHLKQWLMDISTESNHV